MPPLEDLFASLLFGILGLAAFRYGKKAVLWKPMVLGVALMGFPYLVEGTWQTYLVGVGLCVGVVVFRH